MSGLWGVPDNWATSIDGSDELKMGHEAAQIQHLNAMTAQVGMQTQREGLQLQLQQRRMQLMAQRTGDAALTADNLEKQMMEAANDEMMMGNPDKAATIMSHLGTVQNQKANAKLANAKFNDAIYERDIKKREDMHNIFAGINGPEDHATALMILRGKYPDEEIPPELQTYNPQVVEYMKRTTKTGWENAKMQWQRDHDANIQDRHEETLDNRTANNEFREEQRNRRLQQRLDADERRRKSSGSKTPVVGNPDQTMVKAADAMVRKDYPDLPGEIEVGKGQVSSAAYDIASEAKALMTTNRGLSSQEAMARVYNNLKQSGAFTSTTDKGFFKDTKKDTYRKPGPPAAVPLPPKGTALENGKVYKRPDGVLFKWDGTKGKGIVIPGGAGVQGANEVVQDGG